MALRKADYDALLKEDYHGPIVDLLENSTAFLSRMERYEEPTGGRHFYQPLRTGRATSIGARNDGENENLPTAGRPGYTQATFAAKSLYATVRITGFSMRSSKKDSHAFARAQVRDMEDTVKDLKKDVNRQIFADGSAELCQLAANVTINTASTNTVTVSSTLWPTKPSKYLYAGQRLDARVRSTGAEVLSGVLLTVQSVPSTSTVIMLASAQITMTAASIHVFCREDNIGTNSTETANEIKEPNGLYSAMAVSNPSAIWGSAASATIKGNYGGIDRASAVVFRGNRLANGGVLRPLSVNLLQQGMDEAEIVGGGEISLLQTGYPIYRIYGSMLATAKQYEGAMMKLDGGWDALSVNGVPMVKDVDCPDYHVFCIDESTFMLGVIDQWNWIEDDSGGVLTRLPGQDQYEAVMVRDMELICVAPNKNTAVADISHS